MSRDPMLSRVPSSQLHNDIVEALLAQDADPGLLVVAIDGKPTAGKSMLAASLSRLLQARGRQVAVLEVDWFLKDRDWRNGRMKELENGRNGDDRFDVPASFHLEFWHWDRLRDALAAARRASRVGTLTSLRLEGVYDRANGTCDKVEHLSIGPRTILILPGCYLLAKLPRKALDWSILLYVNKEAGWKRKLQRESEKGRFPTVERMGALLESWEALEDPTFLRHLLDHGREADAVVDNSDPAMPGLIKFERRTPPPPTTSVRTRGGLQTRGARATRASDALLHGFVLHEASQLEGTNLESIVDSNAVECTFRARGLEARLHFPALTHP